MMHTPVRPKAPPIKTQGIKTRLAAFIAEHVDWNRSGVWIEPFLGSGAVLLNLQPPRAYAADSCAPVIAFYRALQSGEITAAKVETYLRHEGARLESGGEERYYAVRDRFNHSGESAGFPVSKPLLLQWANPV